MRAVGNTSKTPLIHRDWDGADEDRNNLLLFYDIGHKGPYHPKDFEANYGSSVPWQKLAKDVSSDTTFEEMAADLRQKKFDVEEMKRRGWI